MWGYCKTFEVGSDKCKANTIRPSILHPLQTYNKIIPHFLILRIYFAFKTLTEVHGLGGNGNLRTEFGTCVQSIDYNAYNNTPRVSFTVTPLSSIPVHSVAMDVIHNVVHTSPTNHEYYRTNVHLQSLTESKRSNNPCSSLLKALRVPGGWGSQISRHEGGMVVSPMHWLPLPPRKYSWYSLLLQAKSTSQP